MSDHSTAVSGAETRVVVSDYRLGLERAAHECEWMARGYAAYLMQPLLDAGKRIREIPDDPSREPHCSRRDGLAPRLTSPQAASADVREAACAASPDHADILETIDSAADDWQKLGYTSALAEVRDMANVGRALMDALPKGYSYMNCPSEIVSDLRNERDEALAAVPAHAPSAGEGEKLREALTEARELILCIKQRSYDNCWWVKADDPETAVCSTLEIIDAALATPDAAPIDLPADVRALVIAGREFWDENNDTSPESAAMFNALEAFSERVPYEDEPDDDAAPIPTPAPVIGAVEAGDGA